MVDTQRSGRCESNLVEVQLLFRPPILFTGNVFLQSELMTGGVEAGKGSENGSFPLEEKAKNRGFLGKTTSWLTRNSSFAHQKLF